MRLDAFSFLDADHPAWGEGETRYLAAPPPGASPRDLRARAPSRVVGGLLPVLGVTDGELEAALADGFWRGLLLAPAPDGRGTLTDPRALQWIARAPGRPVVVDCGLPGFSRPEHLGALLAALPPRPVVLTHGGQLNISGQHLEAARALFLDHPHTLLETSGIYRQDFLEDLTGALGPGRILYGSGHPRMDEALEIARVEILPVDAADRAAIQGGNAARVFGVGEGP